MLGYGGEGPNRGTHGGFAMPRLLLVRHAGARGRGRSAYGGERHRERGAGGYPKRLRVFTKIEPAIMSLAPVKRPAGPIVASELPAYCAPW